MKRWFLGLRHSRQIVMVAGLSGLLLAGMAAVLYPMHVSRNELVLELRQERITLARVRQLGQRYRELDSSGAGMSGSTELSAAVNRTLQGQAFQPARMQANGDNGLQISLDAVAFSDVLAWLQVLETTPGLLIAEFTTSQAAQGRVNMTIGLEGSR